MAKKNRREIVFHDNMVDIQKVEFSLDEIPIKINKRILNKMNRRN